MARSSGNNGVLRMPDPGSPPTSTTRPTIWRISRSGLTGWTTTHVADSPLHTAPGVGRFNDAPGADALTWGDGNPRALDIVSSATGKAVRWSEQEMK